MKNKVLFLILFMATLFYGCKGVPMVQTTKEMKELKINESKFVNKPLKYLLKEIGPEIKTGVGNNEDQFYFSFRFTTFEQQKIKQGSLDDRVSLYVYVKDHIDYDWKKRPKGKEMTWTNEDAKKYGDLIVVRIKVIEKDGTR